MRDLERCQADVVIMPRARAISTHHRCYNRATEHREGLDDGERVTVAVCGIHKKKAMVVLWRPTIYRNAVKP